MKSIGSPVKVGKMDATSYSSKLIVNYSVILLMEIF